MKKAISVLFLFYAFHFANGQSWDYSDVKFDGKQIVEVIKVKAGSRDKLNEDQLINVLSFDERNKQIEEVDDKGLFLRYVYNAEGNVLEQQFFEEFNEYGRRIPSDKWLYYYERGLLTKTVMLRFIGNNWVKEDSTRQQYRFNSKGQITEESFYKEEFLWTRFSFYDGVTSPNRLHYYDHLGNLYQPGVKKQITIGAKGDTMSIKTYTHDALGNTIKYTLSKPGNKVEQIKTFKYNEKQQLVEETQLLGDGTLFLSNTYEYNTKGLLKRNKRFGIDPSLTAEILHKHL